MRIVYEEWVWDCVAFEGRWKEDWYDARKVRRAARATAGESDFVLLSLSSRLPSNPTTEHFNDRMSRWWEMVNRLTPLCRGRAQRDGPSR
jgi:hypothetical protein